MRICRSALTDPERFVEGDRRVAGRDVYGIHILAACLDPFGSDTVVGDRAQLLTDVVAHLIVVFVTCGKSAEEERLHIFVKSRSEAEVVDTDIECASGSRIQHAAYALHDVVALPVGIVMILLIVEIADLEFCLLSLLAEMHELGELDLDLHIVVVDDLPEIVVFVGAVEIGEHPHLAGPHLDKRIIHISLLVKFEVVEIDDAGFDESLQRPQEIGAARIILGQDIVRGEHSQYSAEREIIEHADMIALERGHTVDDADELIERLYIHREELDILLLFCRLLLHLKHIAVGIILYEGLESELLGEWTCIVGAAGIEAYGL